MRQRDIPNVKNSTLLLDSFEEFMKRKPVKMRNTYWRAFLAAWVAAEQMEISLPDATTPRGKEYVRAVGVHLLSQGLRIKPC